MVPLRWLSMRYDIIALDYLFNGFPSKFNTYIIVVFSMNIKRLRGRVPLRTISFIYHHFSFLRCFIWLSFLRVVSFSLISFEEKNVREWEKPEINFVEIGWIPLMWKGPLIRFFRRCVFLIGVFYFGKKNVWFSNRMFLSFGLGGKNVKYIDHLTIEH